MCMKYLYLLFFSEKVYKDRVLKIDSLLCSVVDHIFYGSIILIIGLMLFFHKYLIAFSIVLIYVVIKIAFILICGVKEIKK